MIVTLSSKNPSKLDASRHACTRVFGESCVVRGIECLEDLPEQPLGQDETRSCALARARFALDKDPEAEYGVGLEGGVSFDGWLINCVAVIRRRRPGSNNEENHVWGLSFPLPPAAADRILRNKEEMGPVMDDLLKSSQSKGKLGSIGVLTDGHLSRAQMWESALITAFIPFLNPELYPPSSTGN